MNWVDATPHPPLAFEVSADQIAGVRFSRTGGVHGFATEPLPSGSIVPSAIETNILNPSAVKSDLPHS
jgi:hypothetical protein